jgi:hypothetical protein
MTLDTTDFSRVERQLQPGRADGRVKGFRLKLKLHATKVSGVLCNTIERCLGKN